MKRGDRLSRTVHNRFPLIMGCGQAVTAHDFDSCIRRFKSYHPSHGTLAQWLVRAPYKRVIIVRFYDVPPQVIISHLTSFLLI